jgi:4-hydroxy-tetrahydrodipicolinate synthase
MVAKEGRLDVVVQDEPAATGTAMTVDVLVRCVDTARAGAVKLEDPPTPPKIAALLRERPRLDVLGGRGGVDALEELRAGSAGTMTGFAFPEILREVRSALERGGGRRAASVFERYRPLLQLEARTGVGLSIRKELLRRRGALEHATARVAPALDGPTLDEMDRVLGDVGVIPTADRLRVP